MTEFLAQLLNCLLSDKYLSAFFVYDRVLDSVRGLSALDYGCGYGWGSFYLQPYVGSVTGFDIDADRIRFACEQITYEKNLCFTNRKEKLEVQSYDVFLLFNVLEHDVTINEVATEIKRYLRPDGLLFLSAKSPVRKKALALLDALARVGISDLYTEETYVSEEETLLFARATLK